MKRLKVLLFSKYSRRGPSSRLRSLQYLSPLQDHGIDVQVHALFPDAYLETLYGDHPEAARYRAWGYFGQRLVQLLRHGEHDLAWIEGELFPYLPYWIEAALARSFKSYVVDYDDALFHKYDQSANPLVRRTLGRKIDRIMRGAACVIAGNRYLAARASQAGAARVEIIPTVVDAGRYAAATPGDGQPPVIGWVGSPATAHYMLDIRQVLEQVCAGRRARLLLVGARPETANLFDGTAPEVVAWSEASEADTIARMDIGIMPLLDSPWERGKCGYKIIQYMACGLPVVASPVGANVDIVRDGENGLLAADDAAWRHALERLIANPALRARMGRAGRALVETEYSLMVQAPRLADILHRAGHA
jgi:glycosyltransferase involved in cell wall biosynthesis